MSGRQLARLGCLTGMVVLGGLAFHRVFGWGPVSARVVGAAVLAAAIPIVLSVWRDAPVTVSTTTSAVTAVCYIALTTLSAPTALDELVDGVIHGWSELLTSSLPAPAEPVLLVLPVILTWVAAMVSIELALRSRLSVAPLAPPAVLYLVALLVSVGTEGDRIVPALLFVLLGVLALRFSTEPVGQAEVIEAGASNGLSQRVRELAGRVHVSTVLSLAAVVVVGVLAASLLPGSRDDYDPRSDRTPPVEQLEEVNPLALLSDWAQHPNRTLFTVSADRPAAWRLAVLDRYDGVQWTTSARFIAGTAPPVVGAGGESLDQDYRLRGLPGVLLPSAAWPVSATGASVLVDAETGTLARLGQDEGFEYAVRSEVPALSTCELVVGSTTAPPPPAAPEGASEQEKLVYERLSTIVSGSVTSCDQARTLESNLATTYTFDANAPAGSYRGRLYDFLVAEGRGRGTSEQFASAYALLGRMLGLNTRVVVGFHAGEERREGEWVVRSGDAFAWPEVEFPGVGWISFDPTPREGDAPKPPEEIAEEEALEDAPTAAGDTVPTPGQDGKGARGGTEDEASFADRVLRPIGLALLAIMAIVGAALGIAAFMRSRRRSERQNAPEPRARVIGAWHTGVEALVACGVEPDSSRSVAQWVHDGRAALNGTAETDLAPLGVMVNAASFSTRSPSENMVSAAWVHADRVAGDARTHMSRPQRVRSLFRWH